MSSIDKPDNLDDLAQAIETPEQPDDFTDKEIERLTAEVSEMKDAALRALADADNTKKRMERDIQETAKYATMNFARDLVNVCENLHRALESVPENGEGGGDVLKNLRTGVDMTLNELLSVFQKNGLKRIYPLGEKFDHNFHQAMTQVEDAKAEPGTVVSVMQAGYIMHDRLLRPAMVVVSKMVESGAKVDTNA